MKKTLVLISVLIVAFIFGAGIAKIKYFKKETTSSGVVSLDKFSQKVEAKKTSAVDILFSGDVMLDRYNRILIQKNGALWFTKELGEDFWDNDLNVANLEGPITQNQSVSLGTEESEKNHLIFTFDPKACEEFLKENRISLVSIGNNHILNFGKGGLLETKDNLENFEVDYFGDPENENNFFSKEINGRKLAFVNFNQFSKISSKKTVENIKKFEKENYFVIVYAHWGEEYKLVQNKTQENLAHLFVDSGADLVIGSHSHVIQPVEIYKNKAIFYSLGNFIFDQYFSEEVKERLAVKISISQEKIDFYFIPLYTQKNGQIILAPEDKKREMLKELVENFESENVKKEILEGKFTVNKID